MLLRRNLWTHWTHVKTPNHWRAILSGWSLGFCTTILIFLDDSGASEQEVSALLELESDNFLGCSDSLSWYWCAALSTGLMLAADSMYIFLWLEGFNGQAEPRYEPQVALMEGTRLHITSIERRCMSMKLHMLDSQRFYLERGSHILDSRTLMSTALQH